MDSRGLVCPAGGVGKEDSGASLQRNATAQQRVCPLDQPRFFQAGTSLKERSRLSGSELWVIEASTDLNPCVTSAIGFSEFQVEGGPAQTFYRATR